VTIPATHVDLLSSTALAHVATIGPNGAPQSNPVWFGWDGTYVLISQTTARQRYRNLQRTPLIALSIVDLENPFRYLEIRGSVEIVEDTDRAFIDSMARKYLDKPTFPWHDPSEHRMIVKVLPTSTTSQG
jgi:PPOX class probable F420-dependent enzyme